MQFSSSVVRYLTWCLHRLLCCISNRWVELLLRRLRVTHLIVVLLHLLLIISRCCLLIILLGMLPRVVLLPLASEGRGNSRSCGVQAGWVLLLMENVLLIVEHWGDVVLLRVVMLLRRLVWVVWHHFCYKFSRIYLKGNAIMRLRLLCVWTVFMRVTR